MIIFCVGIWFAESLENRIQHYAKKRRIELQAVDNETTEERLPSPVGGSWIGLGL